MTSIVAITRKDSIWMVADRRLTIDGRAPRDDARKIMCLETIDGVALIGYAGLGATAVGTEPSDWMHAVLRGPGRSMEQSLAVLTDAIQDQMPKHLRNFPRKYLPAHAVVAPAFVGEEARLYMIELQSTPDRKGYRYRRVKFVVNGIEGAPPAFGLAGSGALHIVKEKAELRTILKMMRAYEQGRISNRAVADRLAALNHRAHLADQTVGDKCIVAWRNREAGFHKGGGGHQFYTGDVPDNASPSLPSLANGMNISGIADALMSLMQQSMGPNWTGEPFAPEQKELDAAIAKIPHTPDPKLR